VFILERFEAGAKQHVDLFLAIQVRPYQTHNLQLLPVAVKAYWEKGDSADI
jgi:hypothetical protein